MSHVKTMTSRRSSMQTSAAASKIKNKILNTSSFFKVSLKNNNKALARALEEQKERSRTLEREIVSLQKQVETLCFELATRKYKHRKLVLILKNLHSNTLQHLDMVADLFSDSDLPKLSVETDKTPCDVNKEYLPAQRPTNPLSPEPEIPKAFLFPLKKVSAVLPEKENCPNVDSGLQLAPDVCSDETSSWRRLSSQHGPALQVETSRPSSSLREEVERLSVKISQSGFDVKSHFCPQNSLTPRVDENPKQPPSDSVPLPSGSVVRTDPETGSKQEKTLLLNTTMEITLNDPVEIVTVETKAKKPDPAGRPKAKKKEQALGSKVSENLQTHSSSGCSRESQSAPSSSTMETQDPAAKGVPDSEINVPQPQSTQGKILTTSRIPKPYRSGAGSHQKKSKKKLKSIYTSKSKTNSCDTKSPPDFDDYFKDPDVKLSGVRESLRFPPEDDTTEETRPKITCRRSRTKSRRMSTFNTFFVLPSRESEVRHSEPQQIHNAVEETDQNKHEAFKEAELPELLFCAEDISQPESEHDANPAQRKEAETVSVRSLKPRCRGTFVISVNRESTASPEVDVTEQDVTEQDVTEQDVTEQDLEPPAGSSICEAAEEEEVNVMQDLDSSPHRQSDADQTQTTPNYGKRPWLATQDPGSPKQDANNNNKETVQSEQGSTLEPEFQKAKKARREESNPKSKKKKSQRGDGEDASNKKKQKTKVSNKRWRPKDDVCDPADRHEASSFSVVDPEPNKDLQTHEQSSDMKDDIFEYLFTLKPETSKFKMDSNQKQKKRTSKLHSVTNRNLRETFVVQRRKTKDGVRTSNVSDSFGCMVDSGEAAVHQTLGDLLTDEMPPWLAVDVSAVDSEVGSEPATPRRETWSRTVEMEESAAVTAEASPAGRVLTTVTNTISTPDAAGGGRTRRKHAVVSYKEPSINSKMRRGDKFSDNMFLSSPVFKDGRKKKQKKTRTKTKLNESIFVD